VYWIIIMQICLPTIPIIPMLNGQNYHNGLDQFCFKILRFWYLKFRSTIIMSKSYYCSYCKAYKEEKLKKKSPKVSHFYQNHELGNTYKFETRSKLNLRQSSQFCYASHIEEREIWIDEMNNKSKIYQILFC